MRVQITENMQPIPSMKYNPLQHNQYGTAFSSLTVAANLLLKAKIKLDVDDKSVDLKKKDNFDLTTCLSFLIKDYNY